MATFDDIKKDLKDIRVELDRLSRQVPTTDAADLKTKIDSLKTSYSDLNNQLTATQKRDSDYIKINDGLTKSFDDVNKQITNKLTNLNSTTQSSTNMFDDFFGSIQEGLNKTGNEFQDVNTASEKFGAIMNNTGGEGTAFWREYARRIRDVGVEYGLSGKRLDDFRETNLELERQFVGTGKEVTELKDGIGNLYETTGQVNQLTPDFARNLGNISKVMGLSTGEVGRFMGSFMNLNVSFQNTTKILEDLRYAAEKSALNTNKVLSTFTSNFEKLNTYSFSKGVQGMMDMVIQSQKLKINMDSVLKLSDDFTDPEKTMEFASNMQMLGGSFAQLGDFNQLMYDAAVAPEELAKNIANASASVGTFNRESGKLELSFADRLQMKEFAKQTGMSMEELNRMNAAAGKLRDIKMNFNMRPLTEEQESVLGSMAQFKDGQYVVTVKDEKGKDVQKSITELSDEDIAKLSEVQKSQTFESLNVQKMDVPEIIANTFRVGKYSSPDTFKGIGLENEKLKGQVTDASKESLDAFHDNIKLKFFKPIEDFVANKVADQAADVINNVTQAFKDAGESIKTVGTVIMNSDMVKVLGDELKGAAKSQFGGEKKEKGDVLTISKFAEGNILKGLSHSEGGIPFTIGGRSGFEAEGGEVLLTKGVSQDPTLLSLASRINEYGGGKKLFAEGDVINNSFSNKSFVSESMTNVAEKMSQLNNVINNTSSSMMSTMYKNQGGLIDKRGDMMGGSIDVGGAVKVDGNVTFSPISIKIEGTSATREVDTNEKLQKDILSIVEDKIKNMNLYTQFVNKKGTGINDGKLVNIPGITTDIG